MNHGLKALLLAASTMITCMIVGLGFMMAREAKQIGNHVVGELHQYRTSIEEQDLTKYDGAVVYGTDVVNLMKKELSADKNGLRITISEGGTEIAYEKREDAAMVQTIGSVSYIAPTAEYAGEVVRNENDVIVELIFTRKE